jgi:hypothetical protein
MQQVMSPAKACHEVTGLSGITYKAKDGRYTMTDRDAKALVTAGGFKPSLSGVTSHGSGRRCLDCGFGSWFSLCSRCGGTCERESAQPAPETE